MSTSDRPDPWADRHWDKKALSIQALSSPNGSFEKLDLKFLEAIFENCGLQAIRYEPTHTGPQTQAHMLFQNKKQAEAVVRNFDGTRLPGSIGISMQISFVWPTLLKPNKQIVGQKRKLVDSSSGPKVSKKPKYNLIPFLDFLESGGVRLSEIYQFRAAYIISNIKPTDPESVKITKDGASFLYKIFKHATDQHRKGKCWGGNFELQDILVSAVECTIDLDPMLPFSTVYARLDFSKIIDLTLPAFKIGDQLPELFTLLQNFITKEIPDGMESDNKLKEMFIVALLADPAFANSPERRHLVEDFQIFYDGLGSKEKSGFDDDVQDKDDIDWRPITNNDKLLQLIYTDDKRFPPYSAETNKNERYQDRVVDQACCLRHLFVHTPKRSLIFQKQTVENCEELDMHIIHYYPRFYRILIRAILREAINYPLLNSIVKDYLQR